MKLESNTKHSLKEVETRNGGKFSHWNRKKKSENQHEYVIYSSQYFHFNKQKQKNSLSQLWALSLFQKNTLSALFHTSSTIVCRAGQRSAARALCAVLGLETVSPRVRN